jgi:hypothetical protein
LNTKSDSTTSFVYARLAGAFYLVTIAAGLFAEIFVRSAIEVPGNASATAANIANHAAYYRAGEAADIVMLCCYLAVTVLLYALFEAGGRRLSMLAATFSLTGIAVLAGAGLLHLAPLALLDGAGGAFSPAQRDAMIGISLDLHGRVYAISLIFFGIYCILIGCLALRTRRVPRATAALMIVGGTVHVITKFGALLSPELVHLLPRLINVAPLIGEAALALWLVVFGATIGQTSGDASARR